MTTAQQLVDETKRHLLSGQREPMNKLANPVASGATSLTFTYDVTALQAQSYLQIGLEIFYVWSVDVGSKTAIVQPAQQGSVVAAHAAGDLVTINPKFPDFAILKAINDDLYDLSSPANGLFAMRTVELTAVSGQSGYDLTSVTSLLEIYEVRARLGVASSNRQWPLITNFQVGRSVNATDFPSGLSLFLYDGSASGQPISVRYKAAFAPLVNLADDVEAVTGLPASAHDLPAMGAAVRLVAPREIKRNFTEAQGEPRRGQEVPAGAVGNSMQRLAQLRQSRITAEASRLAQLYPVQGFIPAQSRVSYGSGRW